MIGFFLGIVTCIAISYFFPGYYTAMLERLGAIAQDAQKDDVE